MASDEKTSRLAQMQMRFQQRQQLEKEQRRIELSGSKKETETDLARSALNTARTNSIGNGKVRQMFDERRRGAGIDRSNPLKPIAASSKSNSTPLLAQTSTASKVHSVRSQDIVAAKQAAPSNALRRTMAANKESHKSRSTRSLLTPEHIGERKREAFTTDFNDIDDLDNETMPKGFYADGDSISNDSNNNPKKTFHNAKKSANTSAQIRLNPVQTKKSPPMRSTPSATTYSIDKNNPPASTPTTPSKRSFSNRSSQAMKQEKTVSMKTPSPKTLNKTLNAAGKISSPSSPKVTTPRSPTLPTGPIPEGMVACRICGRNFNEDRIAKHEEVCQKMANLKRKVYDATKHRIQGTEAEQYLKKKPARAGPRTNNYTSAAAASGQTVSTKKTNWRQKHEEFISAIRAAKQVQAHLARGGKLSDLPPPPPSENPDYIQCPHCLRRFNQAAAERHIPKCATMLHNKPKPGATNQKRSK